MSLERWSATAESFVLLDSLSAEARDALILMRMWSEGLDGQQAVWTVLCRGLGSPRARVALRALERGLGLVKTTGETPIRFRAARDDLVSPDERRFADLTDQTLGPDRDAALFAAMHLVRVDRAPELIAHWTQLSLHLRCLQIGQRRPAPCLTLH